MDLKGENHLPKFKATGWWAHVPPLLWRFGFGSVLLFLPMRWEDVATQPWDLGIWRRKTAEAHLHWWNLTYWLAVTTAYSRSWGWRGGHNLPSHSSPPTPCPLHPILCPLPEREGMHLSGVPLRWPARLSGRLRWGALFPGLQQTRSVTISSSQSPVSGTLSQFGGLVWIAKVFLILILAFRR